MLRLEKQIATKPHPFYFQRALSEKKNADPVNTSKPFITHDEHTTAHLS
jgi:hypothetical protein